MANKESKKNTGFTLACIILAILVVFIFFLVKKDVMLTNLKETRFFDRVFGSTPEFVENHTPSEKDITKIPLNDDNTITINVEPKKQETPVQPKESEKEVIKQAEPETKPKVEEKKEEKSKPAQPTTIDLQLCFVEIDSEGSVNRKMIKRSIPKTDSPLTSAIKEVLNGPDTRNSDEKNCMSLIPSGTKLLGARVSDGVAYLDFNENFEINTYGVEGYNAQLMQIVYTATTFSTVNSVQFMVEGQKKEYLGSEGQWIGSPLSRNSF